MTDDILLIDTEERVRTLTLNRPRRKNAINPQLWIALRDALKALKSPIGNIPGFRRRIQEIVADKGARKQLLDELGLDEQ